MSRLRSRSPGAAMACSRGRFPAAIVSVRAPSPSPSPLPRPLLGIWAVTRGALELPPDLNNCICMEGGDPPMGKHCVGKTHYQEDVDFIVSTGFDGVKIDNCGPSHNVTLWAELFNKSGKAIRIESCHTFHPNHGTPSSWPVLHAHCATTLRRPPRRHRGGPPPHAQRHRATVPPPPQNARQYLPEPRATCANAPPSLVTAPGQAEFPRVGPRDQGRGRRLPHEPLPHWR